MNIFKNLFKPKWKNNDPTIRKQAIIELNKDDNQAIFIEIVNEDPNSDLRLLALKRITDLDTISKIANTNSDAKVNELALKLVNQILSGETKSDLSEQFRIDNILRIDDQKVFEYVAEKSNSVLLRKTAVEKINREALLGDLAITDQDQNIREIAAKKLTQKSTLERVFKATKTKNKNVSRIVKEKIDFITSEAEKPAKLLAAQKQICLGIENLGNKGLWERDKIQFDSYLKQWADLLANAVDSLDLQSRFEEAKCKFSLGYDNYLKRQEERLKEEAAYLPIKEEKQKVINQLHDFIVELENNADLDNAKLNVIKKSVSESENQWKELASLPKDIEDEIFAQYDDALKNVTAEIKQRLHNKNIIDTLSKLHKDVLHHIDHPGKLSDNIIQKFEHKLNESVSVNINEQASALKQKIRNNIGKASEVLSKHQDRMNTLSSEVKSHLEEIETHITNGVLKEAMSLRKLAQSKIKEMEKSGVKGVNKLKNKLNNISTQVNELSNWRTWANTPQKELLIQKVESLIGSDDDPKEIAFIISQARNEWRKLGPSEKDSSQILWNKFQEACDKAYEPCKVHFAEEAKIMEENYKRRVEFLDNLEDFLAQADWETLDWKKVETLFRHVRDDWQKLGLTDKEKRKILNKRFYTLYNQLKNTLNSEWDKNAEVKSTIVDEAKALIQEEDLQIAINSAKSLQQRWKTAGRIQHAKERELWSQFKSACDAVFGRRDQQNKQKEVDAQKQINLKGDVISKIEALCSQNVKDIGQSKPELALLQKQLKDIGKTNQESDANFSTRLSAALHIYERKLESLEKLEVITDLKKLKQMSMICDELEQAIEQGQAVEIANIENKMNQLDEPRQSEWKEKIMSRYKNSLIIAKQENARSQLLVNANSNIEQKNLAAVQLEIVADIETPSDAADERLKAQMQRLSDKLQNHSEENRWDSFLSAEVNWLITGPILNEDFKTLNNRHNEALSALKSDYPEELTNY